jgi:hypothetical protein
VEFGLRFEEQVVKLAEEKGRAAGVRIRVEKGKRLTYRITKKTTIKRWVVGCEEGWVHYADRK